MVHTTLGVFDIQPIAGQTIIPINYGNGPGVLMLNMRVTKDFNFGPPIPQETPAPAAKGATTRAKKKAPIEKRYTMGFALSAPPPLGAVFDSAGVREAFNLRYAATSRFENTSARGWSAATAARNAALATSTCVDDCSVSRSVHAGNAAMRGRVQKSGRAGDAGGLRQAMRALFTCMDSALRVGGIRHGRSQ
ncbi:MAG TPA: hypothetical protein VHX13_13200 [Acidobacteriaceae bacterium]|nr:hypothetical protein [Acidobacteriaceae bacterium]